MSTKTTKIVSIVLMVLPSSMIAMSAIMKLSGAEQVVNGLTKGGLGAYITLFGVIELVALGLFLYPKTYKLGFLLLCSYLGGAMSIELAAGQVPMAALFLAVIWTSVFLRNKLMFVSPEV